MSNYDWSFIEHRSGESIESLVATLLVLEYPDARQVNPSQGDGGIDVIRETPEGAVVWQVKGFTTALTSSQFAQVRRSWARFEAENVGQGHPPVLEYHLVTPWTPTEERIAEFRELTKGRDFPCRWDGDAYLSGLGDKHPATVHRFTYGEGALEQFVSSRALLASSPVERADSFTMLDAIETRQDALDQLRDQLSDHYRVEHGTLTVSGDGPPMPGANDLGIYHHMTYLGEGRWKYQSLVPRSADSATLDPISWEVTFYEEPESEGFKAIKEWEEWGTPFGEVHGDVRMVGGPLHGTEPPKARGNSYLSFHAVEVDAPPSLFLRCMEENGQTRFRLNLGTVAHTQGVRTGWVRLVADTPEGTMRIDIRMKGPGEMQVSAEFGDVRGRDLESVLREARVLSAVTDGDVFSVELSQGLTLFQARGQVIPRSIENIVVPIAESLMLLQSKTSAALHMPDVRDVTSRQFDLLLQFALIYRGEAYTWHWAEATMYAPDAPEEVPGFQAQLRPIVSGGYMLVTAEEPVLVLGNDAYRIDHPMVTVRPSVVLGDGQDLDQVEPNQRVRLVPGTDDRAVTSMLRDWTPGAEFFTS